MTTVFDVMIDAEYCKGCTYCVIFCPKGCLEIGEAFKSKGYRYPLFRKPEECSGCLSCAKLCPDLAIEIYKEEGEQGSHHSPISCRMSPKPENPLERRTLHEDRRG